MATIKICKYETLFMKAPHIATSYQIIDANTNTVLDESLENKVNLLEWNSPLKKAGNKHHRYETNLKARVKFHYDNGEDSGWFIVGEYNQLDPLEPVYTCNNI